MVLLLFVSLLYLGWWFVALWRLPIALFYWVAVVDCNCLLVGLRVVQCRLYKAFVCHQK
jgi:hypothetical protein